MTTSVSKPVVMIVDDQFRALQPLPRLISSDRFTPLWVPNAREALAFLQKPENEVRIIITDLKSSRMGGVGFLHQVRLKAPRAAVLITGPISPFLYQNGRFYEIKGHSIKRDINTILDGIYQKQKINPQKKRRRKYNRKDHYGIIIGKSHRINEIYALIDNLRNSTATVLIQGRSGTGKELVARTIHQTSSRKENPFVAINCGAIPPSLIESELFGHERGAFTSAINLHKGKFEIADGGTLFLDEIGELDKELQVKLLRVLEEKEFQRVGGNITLNANVRIIAATSQELKKAVENGYFRDDLFYRLNVVPINIPPLRERPEDIALLLDHFIKKYAKEEELKPPRITAEAREALCGYTYPGNIRELKNIVERIFITCPNGDVTIRDLPEEVKPDLKNTPSVGHLLKKLPEGGIRFQDVEKELILQTLELTGGNKTAAANILGITRRRLYLRLAEYGDLHQQNSVTSSYTSEQNCHLW